MPKPPTTPWYRVSKLSWTVEVLDVTRHNEKSVWLWSPPLQEGRDGTEKRAARDTSYEVYLPTLDAAVARVKTKATGQVASAKRILAEAEGILASLESGEFKVRDLRELGTRQPGGETTV